MAQIQTDEEHHTDNDSGEDTKNDLPVTIGQRFSFESLAAQKSKTGFLDAYQPPASKRPSLVPTDNSHADEDENDLVDGLIDQIKETDDSLSELSDENEMDMDDRLAIQYYDCYSKGNMDWCNEYRVHGPECRKCR